MSASRCIMIPFSGNYRLFTQTSAKRCMSGKASGQASGKAQPGPALDASKVLGLSRSVVDVPNEPVGPGAAKDKPYKNPEYFCYNTNSFFEAEVEMAKFRLPQPSSKTPLK